MARKVTVSLIKATPLIVKAKLFRLSEDEFSKLEEFYFCSVYEESTYLVLKSKWQETSWFFFALAVILTIVNQLKNFF